MEDAEIIVDLRVADIRVDFDWCSEPKPKLMTQNLELRKKNSPNCEVLST